MSNVSSKKLVLALGAGGARGLAHIGVLEEIEKTGMEIEYIAGSSVGAVIGALYCHYGNVSKVKHLMEEILEDVDLRRKWEAFVPKEPAWGKAKGKRIFDELRVYIEQQYLKIAVFAKKSLAKKENLSKPLEKLFGNLTTNDLRIPFAACAVDLVSGREVYLKDGKLADIVYCSSAIPGIFPPFEMGEMLLADGSISDLVPVEALPEGENLIKIAVDFGPGIFMRNQLERGMDMLMRADELARIKLNKMILKQADIVIAPDVAGIHWAEFSRYRDLLELGRKAATGIGRKLHELAAAEIPARQPWYQRALNWLASGGRGGLFS